MFKKNYIIFFIAIILIILFYDRGGILGLTVSGIIILIYFYLFKKDVALAFALCMVINSNPYLLLTFVSFGIPQQVGFRTIFFLLSFLVIFSPQVLERRVDYNLKRILPVIFLFVIYQFFVSYLLKAAPDNNRDILRILYRHHMAYLGIYLIIPSYIIFKLDGKKFINAIALASITYTLATVIDLYTPF